mmetsp:Transcript_39440/g.84050  ORF Transcript_39440/g.84050 Transcript_39440/m.84050 type:complete len:346 (-) Transcript_39440:200-1237(-)
MHLTQAHNSSLLSPAVHLGAHHFSLPRSERQSGCGLLWKRRRRPLASRSVASLARGRSPSVPVLTKLAPRIGPLLARSSRGPDQACPEAVSPARMAAAEVARRIQGGRRLHEDIPAARRTPSPRVGSSRSNVLAMPSWRRALRGQRPSYPGARPTRTSCRHLLVQRAGRSPRAASGGRPMVLRRPLSVVSGSRRRQIWRPRPRTTRHASAQFLATSPLEQESLLRGKARADETQTLRRPLQGKNLSKLRKNSPWLKWGTPRIDRQELLSRSKLSVSGARLKSCCGAPPSPRSSRASRCALRLKTSSNAHCTSGRRASRKRAQLPSSAYKLAFNRFRRASFHLQWL